MGNTYNVDHVLGVLLRRGVITEKQRDSMLLGQDSLADKVKQSNRAAYGVAVDVSPAELVAAFGISANDGKVLDEDRVMRELADEVGMTYVRIDPLTLNAQLVTTSLPRRFSKKAVVLPLERNGDVLTVAVDDPYNLTLADELQKTTGLVIERVLSTKSEILKIITEIHGFRSEVNSAALRATDEVDIGNLERLVKLKSEGEIEASDQPIINAVEYLLRYAFDQRASDIHIEPKRELSMVRLRIDGVLHNAHKMPKSVHSAVVSRIKTMARMDIAEKRRPQDGRVKTTFGDREAEIRISTMPVAFGEKVVMRIFDPDILMKSLDELGFYSKELALFRSFVSRPHGIILVTGPTGSGKTTTLYSALKARATDEVNCTTIEDPIEMVIERFNQTAVNPRAGITFASALRTLLRQDPDVIMVGEIRDTDTAENAIQAALTGHLVMSTLHTNDTAAAITRMVDLGIEPFLVGSTLVAVVAQRLLRSVCPGCIAERNLTRDECAVLRMVLPDGEAPNVSVKYGTGCHLCRNTGLRGRVGIYEIMPITDTLRQLINERADGPAILRAARHDGMMTLRESAIRRMVDGHTSFEEVVRVTVDVGDG